MKLHLGGLGDHAQSTIIIECVNLVEALTTKDLKKKKEHNQAMLEIAYALSYFEFDDIKGCDNAKKMWDALHTIYGGDTNVLRTKSKSLRGKFDDMRMEEGDNVAQYCSRIKYVVNAIRGTIGKIDDDIVLSKILRTLLPIYVIRVSSIQELRCIPGSNLTLEGLVGCITAFELSNFDNFKLNNVESTFKSKLTLTKPTQKNKKVKYVSSESDIDEEDVEKLEALLARRFHRGKGKFKGKLITMRLVILLLDVQRRKTIEVVTNTEVEEMTMIKITKTKAISLTTLMKRKSKIDLMIMTMKWCILQLRMHLMRMRQLHWYLM